MTNIETIEKAIELIQEARSLVDSVVATGDLNDFHISKEYYAYGEFGFRQLLGKGNPYDGKLQDIIDKLEEEAL